MHTQTVGNLIQVKAAMLEGTKNNKSSNAWGAREAVINKNSLGRVDRDTMLLPGRDVCSKRINSANWSSAEWVRVAVKNSSKL